MDDLFAEAGLEHDPDLLEAYYDFWEPHTRTDPEAGPLFEELRAAVRLSPDDANAYYQLGQAYQKLGQPELAEQQFALFRQLKDKRP